MVVMLNAIILEGMRIRFDFDLDCKAATKALELYSQIPPLHIFWALNFPTCQAQTVSRAIIDADSTSTVA